MTPDLRRLALAGLLLTACLTRTAPAQVGHDPARSPYRTLRYGQFIGVTGGYFNGDGGTIGVAPHGGPTLGLRYDFLGAGTLGVALAATYGDLERFIVDKNRSVATGRTGPVKQGTMLFEGIVQFNLTGGKSWHRIAPYVSAGIGIVVASTVPLDTSGFKFRTKLALTPGIGARVFLSQRLFLRVEARSPFWQLSYPQAYRLPPALEPGKPPVITASSKEWAPNGWYTIGLAYAFHRPF